jgi:anti-sigma factor RsiW
MSRRGVRCHDDDLSEYATGRLDADRSREWDRHLVACECCRREVAEERRLREALAGGPSMPGDLRASLLAMSRDLSPTPMPVVGPEPLTLLAPGAPPCHRSPLRATVVAAAAAGVSAAAAWSLTVGLVPPRPAVTGQSLPVVSPAGASTRPVGANGATAFVPVRWTMRTSAPVVTDRQAESTP